MAMFMYFLLKLMNYFECWVFSHIKFYAPTACFKFGGIIQVYFRKKKSRTKYTKDSAMSISKNTNLNFQILKIYTHRLPLCVPSPFKLPLLYTRPLEFIYPHFHILLNSSKLRSTCQFPSDILLWQIWLKNIYAQITPMRALPLQFIYPHFHNLLNSSKLRSTCQFPSDILLCQIWLKNLYAQITPMRALPLQTTLLTHSGTLHSQETWKWTAPPTGPWTYEIS